MSVPASDLQKTEEEAGIPGLLLEMSGGDGGRNGWFQIRSMCEAVFAHSQGDDDTLLGPVELDGTAKLGRHTPVHQLTSEPLKLHGRYDGRSASLGPHDDYFIIISVA